MIYFTKEAWKHYNYWQKNDKKKIKKINDLIKECQRTPFDGKGKPEALKENLQGLWSRRIDNVNRFVYKYDNEILYIVSCKFHYKEN